MAQECLTFGDIKMGWHDKKSNKTYAFFNYKLFFEKVQVSPELYGDTRPRFFIYWTVKLCGLDFAHIVFVIVRMLLMFDWFGVAD